MATMATIAMVAIVVRPVVGPPTVVGPTATVVAIPADLMLNVMTSVARTVIAWNATTVTVVLKELTTRADRCVYIPSLGLTATTPVVAIPADLMMNVMTFVTRAVLAWDATSVTIVMMESTTRADRSVYIPPKGVTAIVVLAMLTLIVLLIHMGRFVQIIKMKLVHANRATFVNIVTTELTARAGRSATGPRSGALVIAPIDPIAMMNPIAIAIAPIAIAFTTRRPRTWSALLIRIVLRIGHFVRNGVIALGARSVGGVLRAWTAHAEVVPSHMMDLVAHFARPTTNARMMPRCATLRTTGTGHASDVNSASFVTMV
jgi:hypothetical protein